MLYALLVGINEYPLELGTLDGCVNDVHHFRDYLSSSFHSADLAIEALTNADATRDNIVGHFRTHLGRAAIGDTAVFLYCGHGARWAAASEFKEFYPEGKDEGLVCYDSRRQSGSYPFDLADKELAVLIAEVASRQPHLAVILDCCHSGSGTRDVDAFIHGKARQTHEVFSERPLDTYIDGYYARRRDQGLPISIPRSRHVLLAACDRHEKAYERADRSGLFTSTLLDVAAASGPGLTYADLFTRCRMLIRKEAQHQTPQFEAFDQFRATSGFLGRDVAGPARRHKVYFDAGEWTLDAGAIHGVATDRPALVAVSERSGNAGASGTATTVEVGFEKSTLRLEFAGSPSTIYDAEITSFANPPMPVGFVGDGRVRAALEEALNVDRSAPIAFADSDDRAQYALVAEAERWLVKHRELDLLIQGVQVTDGSHAQAATATARLLKHIARWEHALAVQNARARLAASQFDFVFAEQLDDSEYVYPSENVVLEYSRSDAGWKPVRGRFKARNRTEHTLHVVLAYFSPSYGVHIFYHDRIDPGDGYVTLWGDASDDYFWLEGDTKHSAVEEFKLFVSTQPVDAFALPQDDLVLGRIGESGGARAIGPVKPQTPVQRNEWFAKHIRITIVRQIERLSGHDIAIAAGAIVIKGHSAVTAHVSIGRAQQLSRSINDGGDFYKALERQGFTLVSFSRTPGDHQSVLELTDIQNLSALHEHPLEIELRVPLREDEGILPVVFDGQHVGVAGAPYKDDSGHTRVAIDHVPHLPSYRRGLGGSLKLYFFKTRLRRADVNQLRWVEYAADGTFTYHQSGIAERVAASRNILVLVHGIIGDTEAMVKGVQACGVDRHFDLVMAYDYENLNTSIAETARLLKAHLVEAGLGADDDKRLTLLVHSLGGLVSRWFVEREGGNLLVDHLVMCGTPNRGSPFGKVDDARRILSVLTTLALNYIPAIVPFSAAALLLLNRTRRLTSTLEQMHPLSELIATLTKSDDPGVRYTVLAGDVDAYREPADPFFARMLATAGQSFVMAALFERQAHDIAVGVESIFGLDDRRAIVVSRRTVACHHLNYFASPAGRASLASVDW
jgi:pimeloyl-ACP methyl ester carboxylesterase